MKDISRQLEERREARIILIVQLSLNKSPNLSWKKIKIMFAEPASIFSVISNLIFIFKKFTKKKMHTNAEYLDKEYGTVFSFASAKFLSNSF